MDQDLASVAQAPSQDENAPGRLRDFAVPLPPAEKKAVTGKGPASRLMASAEPPTAPPLSPVVTNTNTQMAQAEPGPQAQPQAADTALTAAGAAAPGAATKPRKLAQSKLSSLFAPKTTAAAPAKQTAPGPQGSTLAQATAGAQPVEDAKLAAVAPKDNAGSHSAGVAPVASTAADQPQPPEPAAGTQGAAAGAQTAPAAAVTKTAPAAPADDTPRPVPAQQGVSVGGAEPSVASQPALEAAPAAAAAAAAPAARRGTGAARVTAPSRVTQRRQPSQPAAPAATAAPTAAAVAGETPATATAAQAAEQAPQQTPKSPVKPAAKGSKTKATADTAQPPAKRGRTKAQVVQQGAGVGKGDGGGSKGGAVPGGQSAAAPADEPQTAAPGPVDAPTSVVPAGVPQQAEPAAAQAADSSAVTAAPPQPALPAPTEAAQPQPLPQPEPSAQPRTRAAAAQPPQRRSFSGIGAIAAAAGLAAAGLAKPAKQPEPAVPAAATPSEATEQPVPQPAVQPAEEPAAQSEQPMSVDGGRDVVEHACEAQPADTAPQAPATAPVPAAAQPSPAPAAAQPAAAATPASAQPSPAPAVQMGPKCQAFFQKRVPGAKKTTAAEPDSKPQTPAGPAPAVADTPASAQAAGPSAEAGKRKRGRPRKDAQTPGAAAGDTPAAAAGAAGAATPSTAAPATDRSAKRRSLSAAPVATSASDERPAQTPASHPAIGRLTRSSRVAAGSSAGPSQATPAGTPLATPAAGTRERPIVVTADTTQAPTTAAVADSPCVIDLSATGPATAAQGIKTAAFPASLIQTPHHQQQAEDDDVAIVSMRDRAPESAGATLVLDLTDSASPAPQTQGSLGGGSQGRASWTAGKSGVPSMFMSIAERRRMQKAQEAAKKAQEEAERQQQQQQQSQPAPPARTESPALPLSAAPSPAPGGQPAAPVNPFFLARKRGSGGDGLTPGSGQPVLLRQAADRPLRPALAPIHVTQRAMDTDPPNPDVRAWLESAMNPNNQVSSTTQGPTSEAKDTSAALDTLLEGGRNRHGSRCNHPLVTDGVPDVLTYFAAKAAMQGAGTAAGLQACKNGMSARVGTAQPQQQGVDLLAELAAYLAALEAPPRSLSDPLEDSQLFDLPCSKEHLSQLESELSELCARDPSSNVPPSAAAAARTAVAPAAAARAAAEPVVIDLENDTVIETVNMVDDTDSAAGKGGQTVQQPSLMWTARFQPAAAAQVCGNREPATELKAWLEGWKKTMETQGQQTAANKATAGTSKRPRSKGWLVSDDDSLSTWADMYDSDDEGHRPEPEPCNNAIVLSGPPGCGKTAAVAAVAKELGYTVMEVNPGSDRGGAAVMKMISEATQSRRIQQAGLGAAGKASGHGADAPAPGKGSGQGTEKGRKGKGSGGGKDDKGRRRAALASDSGGSGDEHSPQKRRGRGKRAAAGGKRRAAAHASDDSDASDPPAPTAGASSKRARVAQGRKSGTARSGASAASGADTLPPQTAAGAVGLAGLHLVVFEEADLLLDDDKGFISTLATLISDTKRPIVLCINSLDPPPGLASLRLRTLLFQRPAPTQVLRTVTLAACAAGLRHTVPLQRLQEVLSQGEPGDIRQALTSAQFWLPDGLRPPQAQQQGQQRQEGGGVGISNDDAMQEGSLWVPNTWCGGSEGDREGGVVGGLAEGVLAAAAARQAAWSDHAAACDEARAAHVQMQWTARSIAVLTAQPPRASGRASARGRGKARKSSASVSAAPAFKLDVDSDTDMCPPTAPSDAPMQDTDAAMTPEAVEVVDLATLPSPWPAAGNPVTFAGLAGAVGSGLTAGGLVLPGLSTALGELPGAGLGHSEGQQAVVEPAHAAGLTAVGFAPPPLVAPQVGAEVALMGTSPAAANPVLIAGMGMGDVASGSGEVELVSAAAPADDSTREVVQLVIAQPADTTGIPSEGAMPVDVASASGQPAEAAADPAKPPQPQALSLRAVIQNAVESVGPLLLPAAPPPLAQPAGELRRACDADLAAVAGLCDLLSECDVLAQCSDPVPPVSGRCAPQHQMLRSGTQALLPGANLAIACLGAARPFPRGLPRAQPAARPPYAWLPAADAPPALPVRLCLEAGDNADAWACMEEAIMQETVGVDSAEPTSLYPTRWPASVAHIATSDICNTLLRDTSVGRFVQSRLKPSAASSVPEAGTGVGQGATGLVTSEPGRGTGLLPYRYGPVPERLMVANQAILCTSLRACVQGNIEEGTQRVSALATLCRVEAERQAACQRTLTGRALRAARTQSVLKTMCPALNEELWPDLAALSSYGKT